MIKCFKSAQSSPRGSTVKKYGSLKIYLNLRQILAVPNLSLTQQTSPRFRNQQERSNFHTINVIDLFSGYTTQSVSCSCHLTSFFHPFLSLLPLSLPRSFSLSLSLSTCCFLKQTNWEIGAWYSPHPTSSPSTASSNVCTLYR